MILEKHAKQHLKTILKKNDVVNFNSDFDGNSLKLYEWYLDGTYVSKIKYRKLVKEKQEW